MVISLTQQIQLTALFNSTTPAGLHVWHGLFMHTIHMIAFTMNLNTQCHDQDTQSKNKMLKIDSWLINEVVTPCNYALVHN